MQAQSASLNNTSCKENDASSSHLATSASAEHDSDSDKASTETDDDDPVTSSCSSDSLVSVKVAGPCLKYYNGI